MRSAASATWFRRRSTCAIHAATQQTKAAANTNAVNRVMQALAESSSVDEAARTALETVKTLSAGLTDRIGRLTPKGKRAEICRRRRFGERRVSPRHRYVKFREGEGLSGRAWKQRDLFFTPDIGQMTDCCRAPCRTTNGCEVGRLLPIIVDGKVDGNDGLLRLETLSPRPTDWKPCVTSGDLSRGAVERIHGRGTRTPACRRVATNHGAGGSNALSLASSSEELSAVSTQMTQNSNETSSQANVVSAAAEEVEQERANGRHGRGRDGHQHPRDRQELVASRQGRSTSGQVGRCHQLDHQQARRKQCRDRQGDQGDHVDRRTNQPPGLECDDRSRSSRRGAQRFRGRRQRSQRTCQGNGEGHRRYRLQDRNDPGRCQKRRRSDFKEIAAR